MARPSRVSDEELFAVFIEIRSGLPVRDAAKKLGIKPATLRYHFTRLTGDALRPTRRRAPGFSVPVDPAVLGYMAGIIDGEGSICTNGCVSRNHPWHVTFSNTNADVVMFFSQHGGRVYRRHDASFRKGTIKSVKPQYSWSLGRAVDVLAFLEAILPYLVIKHGLALKAIENIKVKLSRISDKERSRPD